MGGLNMPKESPHQVSRQSTDASRRDFLRASAATVLGAAAAATSRPANAVEPSQANIAVSELKADIPPHQAVAIPGVHGYAQRSLAAGETLQIRISADVPYRMS